MVRRPTGPHNVSPRQPNYELWIVNYELSPPPRPHISFSHLPHFLALYPTGGAALGYKKKTPKYLLLRRLHLIEGGYLLSHFRTTIGVTGFNFSVRNGKRWNPRAITTLVSSVKEIYSLMPSACVGFPRRIRLEKEFLEATSFAQCIIHNYSLSISVFERHHHTSRWSLVVLFSAFYLIHNS